MISEVTDFIISCFRELLDMLLSEGGIIGLSIVCMPILSWALRSVRSLISKK